MPDELSVLEVIKERVKRSIDNHESLSINIAVGFFFFEGFQKIVPCLKELHSKGLLKSFRLIMGPDTKKGTKEVLEALKTDAFSLGHDGFAFLRNLYEDKLFQFRIFLRRGFHIKLYLFDFSGSGLEVWAGSANLTEAGLAGNIELIVPTGITLAERDAFREFFNRIWDQSSDKIENLHVIDIVKSTVASEFTYLHPRDFFSNLIKITGKEYLIKNITSDLSYLAEFQNMSYYLCVEKLKNIGGCILANSPGIGKTDVCCTIARYYRELEKNVMIIIPPVLESQWKQTIKKVGLDETEIAWLSRGLLQNSNFDYKKYKGVDLIIVDEAHHFRTTHPKSNRRENLENILKMNPNAHVLLVTATPINTSFLDLTELTKLFLKGKYKEKIEGQGILSKIKEIENAVEQDLVGTRTIQRLNELIAFYTIRIEWPDLLKYFKADLKKISGIDSFESPDVERVNYRYDQEIIEKIFDKVIPFLEKLNFEYSKLWENEYKEDKNLKWWYQWRLYKRLESSITAFRISIEHFLERNIFLKNVFEGAISREEAAHAAPFAKARLANIVKLFKSLNSSKKATIIKKLDSDIHSSQEMINCINSIKDIDARDEKISALLEILAKDKKPTIIFSESRDTVLYIAKCLKTCSQVKFNIASGDEDPIDEIDELSDLTILDKDEIQRQFNNGFFDVLVTTDVMGEGVNLPRADVVVNFDLPYNPVKLIQRDGRAIRITNPKKIKIYNFEPDLRIDKELELSTRIDQRVKNIVATIGLDFVIWSIEQKNVEEITEENKKRILSFIREYKDLLATRAPEDLGKRLPATINPLDSTLRDYIKFWSISEETVAEKAKEYSKPIVTGLKNGQSNNFFIIFRYRNDIHYLGALFPSREKSDGRLTASEIAEIKGQISKHSAEIDKEFIKQVYRKTPLAQKVENALMTAGYEQMMKDVDISQLTKSDQQSLLALINNLPSLPPWKRETEIGTKLKEFKLQIVSRGYQKSFDHPKLLAVVKYE